MAMCTTSVTVIFWRPRTKVVLDSNPGAVITQLDDSGAGLRALTRYLQVRVCARRCRGGVAALGPAACRRVGDLGAHRPLSSRRPGCGGGGRNTRAHAQVLSISIGLGFLAYLSLLANINRPGNPAWTMHLWLSLGCHAYLAIIIFAQVIQMIAYLPVMHVSEPRLARG